MTGLRPKLEIITLDAGSRIYHFSNALPDLLASRSFDPGQSSFGAAMFFTEIPVAETNCEVEIVKPCTLVELDEIRTEDEKTRPYIGLQLASRAMAMGLDGFRNEKWGTYTRREDNSFAAEIIILHDSLQKLLPKALQT